MAWEGKTPTVEIVDDVTPVTLDKCYCGSEKIFVDGDEKPPMTREEMDLQFYCLISRAGDWEYCNFHKETWARLARS